MSESVLSTLHSSRSASHLVGLMPDRELTCRRKRIRFSLNTQPGPLPRCIPDLGWEQRRGESGEAWGGAWRAIA